MLTIAAESVSKVGIFMALRLSCLEMGRGSWSASRHHDGPEAEVAYSLTAMLGSFRATDDICQLGCKALVVVLDVAGQSRRDLLEHPAIAVGVTERRIGGIALALGVGSCGKDARSRVVEDAASIVEGIADRDAAAIELAARGFDIGNDQVESLN